MNVEITHQLMKQNNQIIRLVFEDVDKINKDIVTIKTKAEDKRIKNKFSSVKKDSFKMQQLPPDDQDILSTDSDHS